MSKAGRKGAEGLEQAAREAAAAGMTYGQYQQSMLLKPLDKSNMRSMQPVYIQTTKEYICPQCAHPLVEHKNCGHCGKVLIWKNGGKTG